MKKILLIFAVSVMIAAPGAGFAIEGEVGGKPSLTLVDGRIASVADYMPKEDPPIPLGEHVVYMPFNSAETGIAVTGEMAADNKNKELPFK